MLQEDGELIDKSQETSNLPEVMAGLEMLSVDTKPNVENRMVLRTRFRKSIAPPENLNRRSILKPRKRCYDEMESEDSIKNYYLDKNIKNRTPINLETIFEEEEHKGSGFSIVMSKKKFKRMIHFSQQTLDSKIKKRRARIKKNFGSRVHLKKKGIGMQAFLERLNKIQSESPVKEEPGGKQ